MILPSKKRSQLADYKTSRLLVLGKFLSRVLFWGCKCLHLEYYGIEQRDFTWSFSGINKTSMLPTDLESHKVSEELYCLKLLLMLFVIKAFHNDLFMRHCVRWDVTLLKLISIFLMVFISQVQTQISNLSWPSPHVSIAYMIKLSIGLINKLLKMYLVA